MYESGNEIIDTIVKTKDMQGGRLGKVSNKMIVISISWFATYNIVWILMDWWKNSLTPL